MEDTVLYLEVIPFSLQNCIAACSVLLLLLYLCDVIKRYIGTSKIGLPPGPTGLPIVGYLPFLGLQPHVKLTELAKKFGDVFSLRMGAVDVVVVSGEKEIKEAFTKKELFARPPTSFLTVLGHDSVYFSNDTTAWTEQRKFILQALKENGLGKSEIEKHIQMEVSNLLEIIRSREKIPLDLEDQLTAGTINNIVSLVQGSGYKYNDLEGKTFVTSLVEVSSNVGQVAVCTFFPWTSRLPFFRKWMNLEKTIDYYHASTDIIKKNIKKHIKNLTPSNAKNFIDLYLNEIKVRKAKNSSTTFTEKCLKSIITDIYGAGSDTVRTTVSWCLYVMAAYPHVQKKVQEEVDRVIGIDRVPSMQDQQLMPYTQAVIMETMRWKTITPLSVPRYATEDTRIGKHDIPRGTTVMANFWAIHHDPRHWENPEDFVPERFLEPDGETIKKNTAYMPFANGKRGCPGESLAKMEIFLYLVNLLQNFDVSFPEDYIPAFEAELTITYKLKSHKLCFTGRRASEQESASLK